MTGVARAAPWFFRGTGLRNGDRFGTAIWRRDRHENARFTARHRTLLATIPDIFGPGRTAEMTYYETPRGAPRYSRRAPSTSAAPRCCPPSRGCSRTSGPASRCPSASRANSSTHHPSSTVCPVAARITRSRFLLSAGGALFTLGAGPRLCARERPAPAGRAGPDGQEHRAPLRRRSEPLRDGLARRPGAGRGRRSVHAQPGWRP